MDKYNALMGEADDGEFKEESMCGDTIMTVVCKKCGGSVFYVGEADWQTLIKCVACKWELSIHEG